MRSLDMSLVERTRIVFIVNKSAISTLGMSWFINTDQLQIKIIFDVTEETISKISILSFVSSVSRQYDPLGFVAPVTIRGRIFLQDL